MKDVAMLENEPQLHISRALAAFLLVIVLVACGSNTAATSPPTPLGNTGKKATNASTSTNFNLNATNIHAEAEAGNLLIQSANGFQCPSASLTPQDLELGHLVLASDRTNYSQTEITQMRSYLTSYLENGGVFNGMILSRGIAPPPTLRWVLGGETAPLPGTLSNPLSEGCAVTFTLANRGTTPIQIPKVGVQLQARPQPNTYQYRLIDACSITGSIPSFPYCPPTGEGGGGSCSVYAATVQLGMGEQNDVFSAVPYSAPDCGALTIPPAAQVSLKLAFSLAANVVQNLIYSIVPVFMVDTTQGEHQLSLSNLVSTLAFARASQFSCYRLQGTTFVLLKSPVFGVGPDYNWCL